MPELPELQAHAERLDAALRGATLRRFEPLSFTVLKTVSPAPEETAGRTLERISRRGKHLLVHFGQDAFVVWLAQGGRLRMSEPLAKAPRGALARWSFADERGLVLTEPGSERRAGVWLMRGDPEASEPLSRLGPEADRLDAAELGVRLRLAGGRLHRALRDQAALAGVGRRLADEICWRARLSPFARVDHLEEADEQALAAAVAETIAEGLASDRRRTQMSSVKDRPSAVHDRAGQPCPRCAAPIRAIAYRSHTIHYCPPCQTGGRILADNTTSRFLR